VDIVATASQRPFRDETVSYVRFLHLLRDPRRYAFFSLSRERYQNGGTTNCSSIQL